MVGRKEAGGVRRSTTTTAAERRVPVLGGRAGGLLSAGFPPTRRGCHPGVTLPDPVRSLTTRGSVVDRVRVCSSTLQHNKRLAAGSETARSRAVGLRDHQYTVHPTSTPPAVHNGGASAG